MCGGEKVVPSAEAWGRWRRPLRSLNAYACSGSCSLDIIHKSSRRHNVSIILDKVTQSPDLSHEFYKHIYTDRQAGNVKLAACSYCRICFY